MDHTVVRERDNLHLVRRQAECGATIVKRLDPREQLGIEVDRIAQRGQLGRGGGVDRVELVVGVGGGQRAEHRRHAVEHLARAFECFDGVGKSGHLGAIGDGADFGLLDGDALLDRGLEIVVMDLREIGRVERQRRRLREHAGAGGTLREGGRGGSGEQQRGKRQAGE